MKNENENLDKIIKELEPKITPGLKDAFEITKKQYSEALKNLRDR